MDTHPSLEEESHASDRTRRRHPDARLRRVVLATAVAAVGATAVGRLVVAAAPSAATSVIGAGLLLGATLGSPALVGVAAVRLLDPDR